MPGARAVVAAVVVAAACLLAGCSTGDGILEQLEADPVWQLEVPGTTVVDESTREGGPALGKRSVAGAARTLVPDDPADAEQVRDTVAAVAEDAGWTDREDAASGAVRFSRTIDGVHCRLYLGIQDDGVRVSLDAS